MLLIKVITRTLPIPTITALTNHCPIFIHLSTFKNLASKTTQLPENVNTSINYLSTMMLEAAGMKMSPFNRFLSDMHNEVPILTSHGYYGNDGVYYSLDDTTSPYYSSLENYHILQYNDLFDKKNRIDGFFD